jgi:peptidoglycan/LPS O-acetylase OafA/YrhL
MTNLNGGESSRLPVINGLRGIAVILVLGFHFDIPFFERGYWGVDLFFWISGFLITGGFLREYALNRELNQKFGWIDTRYYFLRRIRRLLPLSLLVLVVVVTVNLVFGDEQAISQTLRRIPRILSFTLNMQLQGDSQDYFLKSFQDFGLLHYWSLSVEEQIYVLSPFLFLFAISFHGLSFFGYKSKWYQRVLVLNVILSIASFWFMIKQNQVNSIVNYYSTFSRFWEFGLGAIIAVLAHIRFWQKITSQVRMYLIHVSSITIIFSFILLENRGFGPLVLIPLASTSIFVLLTMSGVTSNLLAKVLEVKGIQFFGDIAFPLYLVHWPAMVLLRNTPNQSSLINILIYLVATILISYLLHRYVEKPTMALDISRFRQSNALSALKYHPRSAFKIKRISVIMIFSLVVPITLLSYPKASENSFAQLRSVLTDQRYGTVSEQNQIAKEESKVDSPETVPEVESSIKLETITPGANPQGLGSSPSPTVPTSPTSRSEMRESTHVRWFASLKLAVETTQAKKSYVADQLKLMEELRKSWFSGCLDSKSAASSCVLGSGDKEIVLLGDSFSFALKEGLFKSLPSGWQIRILTKGSCLPWKVPQYNSNGTVRTDCTEHATWVEDYLSESRPAMIVATGADQWLANSSYDLWPAGFRSTVQQYLTFSEKVVIFSSAPGSGNLKDCASADLSMRKCFGTPNGISRFVAIQKRESQNLKFRFVNLIDFLCIDSACPAVIGDTPVYADGNHLSADFSKKFSEVLKRLQLFDST